MDLLGIFAKYWEPGHVKTRLAQKIGGANASHLYLAFLTRLLKALEAQGDRRVVCFWPPASDLQFQRLAGPRWQLECQCDGDLGTRMEHFFRAALAHGARRVVLIGSDCPTLTADCVDRAFYALSTADCVLGPSRDGGYYLIGLRRVRPELFREIPWSSSSVFCETMERLKQLGWSQRTLEIRSDVDDIGDLAHLCRELKKRDDDPALLAQIESALSGNR